MKNASLSYIHKQNAQLLPMKPPTNVYEYDDRIEVLMEMPGIAKESLNVELYGRVLKVEAIRDIVTDGNLLMGEIKPIRYYRSFELADNLDENHISSEYYHGILKISIPKKPEAKIREIKIN